MLAEARTAAQLIACQATSAYVNLQGGPSAAAEGEQGARSVLGELQQNGPAGTHRGEDFDSWTARKQLQNRVSSLQARVKVGLSSTSDSLLLQAGKLCAACLLHHLLSAALRASQT